MAKSKPEARATRAEIFDAGREALAAAYTFLAASGADHTLPLTNDDRAAFKRLRRRVSAALEDFNEQGRK